MTLEASSQTQRHGLTPIHGAAVTAIVNLLDAGQFMSLAVNRPDGWPQVTTVGYVNEGLNLYFITARASQKFANIQADPRVSIAIRSNTARGDAVGVSMAGWAQEVIDPALIEHINALVFSRYPGLHVYCPGGSSVAVIHLKPEIVSPVGVVEGRSIAQTFALGGDAAGHGRLPQP